MNIYETRGLPGCSQSLGLAIYDHDLRRPSPPEEPVVYRKSSEVSRWSVDTRDTDMDRKRQSHSAQSVRSTVSCSDKDSIKSQNRKVLRPESPQQTRTPYNPGEQSLSKARDLAATATQRTRRPSLTQTMIRTFSGSKKPSMTIPPVPTAIPPLPVNAAAIAHQHASRVGFAPLANQKTDARRTSGDRRSSGDSARRNSENKGRRPSFFQVLRKSFSKNADSPVSSPRKSSIETVRKLSKSSDRSDRRPSDRSNTPNAAEIARSVLASARQGHRPSDSGSYTSSPSTPHRRPMNPPPLTLSPAHLAPTIPTNRASALKNQYSPRRSPPQQVPVYYMDNTSQVSLTNTGSEMSRQSSASSDDSMFDLYSHDELLTPADSLCLPNNVAPAVVTPVDDEKPAWQGSDMFGSAFINPWSAKLQPRPPSTIDIDASPGGRRSSIASSRLSDKRPRSTVRLSAYENDFSPAPKGRGRSASSVAASRRASLAAVVQQQQREGLPPNHGFTQDSHISEPDSPASIGSNLFAQSKKKPRPVGMIHGGLLNAQHSTITRARKPSLVMPGDPRLLQRRKSSLSVTFSSVDSEDKPIPPMPNDYVDREMAYFGLRKQEQQEETSSISSASISDASLAMSVTPMEAPVHTFFQLRNPWTGKSVAQPQSPAFAATTSGTPPAGDSRRQTMLPSTPKSAKSGSISSTYNEEWKRRGSVKGSGLRVSLDVGNFSTYSMSTMDHY